MAFAAIAPILGAVGTGISAIGAISQGQSQAAEAHYQAQVAANNQVIANQNAAYATQAGEAQTYDIGLRERATAGKVRAGLAANNVDVNSGSAKEAQESQAELGQLAEERTKAGAGLTAYGYRTQATSFQAQSQLQKTEAPMDVSAGFLKAGGTLLSGASNIGFKWDGLTNPTAAATTPDVGTSGRY